MDRMTRIELDYIAEAVDVDYIIDNPEGTYTFINRMLNEIRNCHMDIQANNEAIKMYWPFMDMLRKENKKLHKEKKELYTKLSKYEK